MNLRLVKNLYRDDVLRRSFNELALAAFGISFEGWHDQGWWTDRYQPYALAEGRRIVANVSVSLMEMALPDGARRKYIQLGTIMTDPAYRNQGLARRLMETVLEEWRGRSDGMYLFANGSVLDFYPKFGFGRRTEYQHYRPWTPGPAAGRLRRLNPAESPEDVEILRRLHHCGNPWAALAGADNFGLLMFYSGWVLADCFWYSKDLDAVIAVSEEGGELLCFDAFAGPDVNLTDLLALAADIPGSKTRSAVLGFTPRDADGWLTRPMGTDDALFTLDWAGPDFEAGKLMLPLLTHA